MLKQTSTERFFTNKFGILITAILCCLLWGSAYPSIKIGYELFEITTVGEKIVFAGYRFFVAGILTLIAGSAILKQIIIPPKAKLTGILLLGFVQTFLQYVFFYIGLSNTTGVKGSILNATGTFAGVILAHFFYKNDRMTLPKTIGTTVGFLGIIIINLGDGFGGLQFTLTGEGFLIITGLSFAVGSLISKQVTAGANSIAITGYQLSAGGIMLILFGTIIGGQIPKVTGEGILLFSYMAALSAVAFTLWMILLKYNKMGKITIYNFFVPIFGSLLSSIFLGEEILKVKNLVALIFVSAGIYLVNRVKLK